MKQQTILMIIDPAWGTDKPYPSHAEQYRKYHGEIAWLYNPWTKNSRDPRDIGMDPFGFLIIPPGEPTSGGDI